MVIVDVTLWGSKTDSGKTLRDLSEVLWFTMDRAPITATGYDVVYWLADPPRPLTDRNGFPGYNVTCNILVRKE